MPRNSRVKHLAAVAAGAVGAAALLIAPAASAAPQAGPVQTTGVVTKTVAFTCAYPLIGNRLVSATVTATFPSSVAVGTPINTTDFSVAVGLDATTVQALTLIGSATVEGTAVAGVDLVVNSTALGVTLPGLTIPKTSVTGTPPVNLTITGPVPSLTVKAKGSVAIAIGSTFTGKITPKRADGTLTGLGTFDLTCSINAGQNPALVTIPVV
ncbi:DUF6801 domain-containing protein [Actinokineospora bangkokensis]|uniref:DUF6801 domain-containing protein n=1 Tax=Actinokineospora bangkokensis TaxID=1193682 RepID=A0A1Q9LNR9_9PSEU|nr:DUF6801 domain-containing protein [Actinokineospora bangkokensis]OLR93634.1 hypothetical protein BJP25_15280 [Actinokineospora bangkokensis]